MKILRHWALDIRHSKFIAISSVDLILLCSGGFVNGEHLIVEIAYPGQFYSRDHIMWYYFQLQTANERRFNAMVLEFFLATHDNDPQPVYLSGFGIPEEF